MNFKWDWNEWFIVISSIGSICLFYPIRKYFPPMITFLVWMYSIAYVETIDYFLVGSPFNLYYFSDNETYEPSALIVHFTQYSCSSLLFLYFYDKWKLRGMKLVAYILIWTVISVIYEWICLVNKVLTYTGWKLIYSIPTYPISSLLLIMVYHFIQKHLGDPFPKEGVGSP